MGPSHQGLADDPQDRPGFGPCQRRSPFLLPRLPTAAQRQPELAIGDGHFECFRCGARGDVVGLVKLARKCDLETAIAWLEQETIDQPSP